MLEHRQQLSVAYRSRPFSGRVHQATLQEGLTCAEIIATVPDLDLAVFLDHGVFCINGEVVPREMWAYVKPKARNDVVCTMHMPILGGGGSSKDVIRLVAAIAIVVVATLVSGGAAAPLLGSAFAAGTIGATVLAAAISVGGALLLGAFVKPPSTKDQSDLESAEGKPAALTGNQLLRGGPVPRVVGTHRAFPPFLAQPLIDLIEYDEVAEAVYGFAGPHQLRDVKFGGVFADDIDPEQFAYQVYELKPGEGGINENTHVMLPCTGIQDSEVFEDLSPYENAFTVTGDVFIDKLLRESWIGRAAGYFSQASTASFITCPMKPHMIIGGLDFSVEFFLEFDATVGTAGVLYYIAGQVDPVPTPTAAQVAWFVHKDTSGRLNFTVSDGSTLHTVTTTTNVEVTGENRNYHFVGARIGGVLRAWVNAVQEGGDVPFTGNVPILASAIAFGARQTNAAASACWPGWLNQMRLMIGETGFENGVAAVPEITYRPDVPNLITRYGRTGQPGIILDEHHIKNDEDTQGSNDKLSNQSVPTRSLPLSQSIVVRGRNLNEIWITLGFPTGLSYFDDGVDSDWFFGMAYRVRVRELGSPAWKYLPEVHIHDRRTAPLSRMLVFRWDQVAELGSESGQPNVAPPAQKGWKAAYSSVPTQTLTPVGIGGWEADEHFYASGSEAATYLIGNAEGGNAASTGLRNIRLTTERAEFFLHNLVLRGALEIEIRRSQLYVADSFNYATYEMDVLGGGVCDLFGYLTLDGEQVILLKQSNSGDQVVISRAASVWNRPPIAQAGVFSQIYTRVRARNLDVLSVEASGLVPDWDGSAWTGLNATSNPAPHYRDVLVGELNDNRIPPELVDDSVLLEWRTRCDALGFTCDAVFDGAAVDRVLEVIASCGYARPRQSELWDVAQDRDFSLVNPVQMFTPRNMNNFRWDKAFLRHRPDGLRVKYQDSSDDYVERTIVVPRTGVLSAEAGRLEEIRYDGLVTERSVVTKATYDQRQVVDRFTFYYGSVDVESLVCRRGDLVLVQHDVLDQYAGFSRVLSTTLDGDSVVTIRLDGSITPIDAFFVGTPPFFDETPIFFTDDVGVAIRLKDGTTITFTAAVSADGLTITPSPAIANAADLILRECLVMTGRILTVTKRLIVYEISARADLTADIAFVDEAPALWSFPADIPPVPPDVEAVRMYHQYTEAIHQGSGNRVQMSQQYVEVPYTPDEGVVQMFQQYVEVPYSVEIDDALRAIAATSSTAATITGPTVIQAGDLLVLYDVANGVAPASVVPAGFDSVFNVVSGAGTTRFIASWKIATGAEAGAAITGMDGSVTDNKLLYVFRHSGGPILSVTESVPNSQNTAGDPSAQIVTGSGVATPYIVFGCYTAGTGIPAISPRSFTPAKSGEITLASGWTSYLAYKVIADAPVDVTIDMEDEGLDNFLASFSLSVTI